MSTTSCLTSYWRITAPLTNLSQTKVNLHSTSNFVFWYFHSWKGWVTNKPREELHLALALPAIAALVELLLGYVVDPFEVDTVRSVKMSWLPCFWADDSLVLMMDGLKDRMSGRDWFYHKKIQNHHEGLPISAGRIETGRWGWASTCSDRGRVDALGSICNKYSEAREESCDEDISFM